MGWFTNAGKRDLAAGGVAGRELRILFVTAAPASAAAAADLNFVSQVAANESPGAGRQTLASVATAEDDTNDRATIDATDPTDITPTNGSAAVVGAWIYRRATNGTDTDATDILWCYLSATPAVTPNGGAISIAFNAAGFATIA